MNTANQIHTNPNYWDCECVTDYVHLKSEDNCPVCGSYAEDQPDSRSDEVGEMQLIDLIRQFVKTNDLDAIWGHSDEGYITVQFGTTGFPPLHPDKGAV